MSVERVREYFAKEGIADRIQEFDVSSATVELAAQALHCDGCRIAKTLSFHVDDRVVLIVAAGDARIDNRKYKDKFGKKAKMLAFEGSGRADRPRGGRGLSFRCEGRRGGLSG